MSINIDQQRREIVEKITDDVANNLVINLKKKLDDMGKDVTGRTKDSIEYNKGKKEVGSELEHSFNIEFGRQAGSHVPLEPLKEWAKIKFNLSEGEAWGMAKTIEKKIFEEGIDMTRFMKITLEDLTNGN